MNTTLSIKNFRVFDENGVDVQLSPITILTGCNSSGKSSIVKSMLLLDSFLKQAKRDYDNGERIRLDQYKLDFSTYPNNKLGRYDKIVNHKSESKRITFAYTLYSLLLSKEVNVEFVFNTDENDELDNGFLESLSISNEEGIIFSSAKQEEGVCNVNLIKEDAIRFVTAEFFIQNYSNASGAHEIEGNVSKEEVLIEKKRLQLVKEEIGKGRFRDIFNSMRHDKRGNTIVEDSNCDPKTLEWTWDNLSCFFIPVVEELRACGKENIQAVISEKIFASRNVSGQVREVLKKILDDFFASDCHTFGEYFRQKENEFMENVAARANEFSACAYSFHRDEKTPSIYTRTYFDIKQNYLFADPRSWNMQPVNLLETEEPPIANDKKRIDEEEEASAKKWLDTLVDFHILYEVLMEINRVYTDDEPNPYYKHFKYKHPLDESYCHTAFKALGLFVNKLIIECILPTWVGNVSYVSSSRIDVKRLYPLDDNTDFTLLLKKYFEEKRLSKDKQIGTSRTKDYLTDSFSKTWLKKFGVGESLKFDVDKEGLGVKIYLHHSTDADDSLLADEGYGITQLVSILMQIETAIVSARGEDLRHLWGFNTHDGYDQPNAFHYEQQTIVIEEPEIHLHPKFQSLLADMFADAYKNYNIHFIIETHSEYLIRKMQLLVMNKDVKSNDISLLYAYSPDESKRPDGEPQIKDIGICSDGYLNEPFGPGFFDEATSLSRQLLN